MSLDSLEAPKIFKKIKNEQKCNGFAISLFSHDFGSGNSKQFEFHGIIIKNLKCPVMNFLSDFVNLCLFRYHRRLNRVPTIDECYMSDWICREEAQMQFVRDKKVEGAIVRLLERRLDDCCIYNMPHQKDDDPGDPCYQTRVSHTVLIFFMGCSLFS